MKDITRLPDANLRVFDRPTLPGPADIRDVYLIGICGTGMGSLAGLFHASGRHVRGSDSAAWPPMSTRLAELGIKIQEGYDPANLSPRPDLVIVGNACTPTHVEATFARDNGLVQASFPEALAHYFIADRRSIVITGTHGKTTTTSILVHVLRSAGLDPGFLVGGVMVNENRSYGLGTGPHFVVEGDEYDSAYFDKRPKFVHYRPSVGVVTSMEFDHADIYDTWDDYREAFRGFASSLDPDGTLVLNADDEEVADLARFCQGSVTTYGLESTNADVTARHVEPRDGGVEFRLIARGEEMGICYLPLSGRHNLLNALAILTVGLSEGVPVDELRRGLLSFAGIKRRQEIIGIEDDVIVVDDFAHHPTAVRATLQAARERWPSRRVVAVFEPRSNSSRRKIFQEGYTRAFRDASAVFISIPPFRHNDRLEDFIDVGAILERVSAQGSHTFSGSSADDLLPALDSFLEPGDVAVIMSNGGFGSVHVRLLSRLRARTSDPVGVTREQPPYE
jgi:UDP-N-acetylmuramate: L-alanyl-gamma-D-glutamyl-meso-diaminopimelate ligase